MTEDPFTLVVAHLFRRSGRDALSENEFANAASLDLRWFSPKDARALVAGLVRSGHLEREEDGRLRPSFDTTAIDVPLTFRPPPDLHAKVPPAGSAAARPAGAPPRAASRGPPTRDVAPSTPIPPPSGPGPSEAPIGAGTAASASVDHVDSVPTHVPAMLEALAAQSGEPVPVWVERMNRTVQDCGDLLAPEAALLVAAAREGVDVAVWAPSVQAAFVAKRATRSR